MSTRFDHLRPDDGEHVGYIELSEDGRFIPFDLLHRCIGDAMGLEEAEEALNSTGLGALTEEWLLLDGDEPGTRVRIREVNRTEAIVVPVLDNAAVAKALDLNASIRIPLPTDRLLPTSG